MFSAILDGSGCLHFRLSPHISSTFVFANFQASTPVLTDNIGALNERANGAAVLRVRFSDGASGVLTVGCHGPGAPSGDCIEVVCGQVRGVAGRVPLAGDRPQ